MRKKIIVGLIFFSVFLSGCSSFHSGKTLDLGNQVWWGNKTEIITFLNSPDAKAEKWFIQDIESIS